MATKVAINGFGRIGRLALRAIIESGRKDLDVIAINDLGSAKFNAHLLQYDSVHGIFSKKVTGRKSSIGIGNKSIKILYGGSVNSNNVDKLKIITGIDGFLIGGASQNSNKFIDIIKKTIN